jgi:hypothetical protein
MSNLFLKLLSNGTPFLLSHKESSFGSKEVDESVPNPMFIRDKERTFIKMVSYKSTKDIKLAIGYSLMIPSIIILL